MELTVEANDCMRICMKPSNAWKYTSIEECVRICSSQLVRK